MPEIFNINDDVKIQQKEPQKVTVEKNIALIFPSDVAGCGHIRSIFPFTYLNSVFGKQRQLMPLLSPFFIKQEDILIRTRSIWFQRQMTPFHVEIIKGYKLMKQRFGYKMIYDIDDMLWGRNENQGGDKYHGIPSYNFAATRVSDEMKQSSIDIINEVDVVSTSTEYLKKYIENNFGHKNVIVVYNTVPLYLYGSEKSQIIQEKIQKPRIMYAGSPTHYSNQDRLPGDLGSGEWIEYIIKNVKDNKITFAVMSGDPVPFPFEEIKNKITSIPWVNSYRYPIELKKFAANFIISPLIDNEFNSAKSDIKYIESCAVGAICIGSYFESGRPSPYDNNIVKVSDKITLKEIEELIDKYTEPEIYNETVSNQYKMLVNTGRYLESPKYINHLSSIL